MALKKVTKSRKKRSSSTTELATNGWLTKTQKYIVFFIGICSALGIIWSGMTKADSRYAKDSRVREAFNVAFSQNKYLESRVDVVELEARRDKVQFRLWDLEKEFRGIRMPEGVLKQKMSLEKELREIDEAIDFYHQQSIKSKIQSDSFDAPAGAGASDTRQQQQQRNPYIKGK